MPILALFINNNPTMNFIEKHNSENTDSKLIFTVSKKKERITMII